MKRICVPEGMLKAAISAWGQCREEDPFAEIVGRVVEAALGWLAENPPRPETLQTEAVLQAVREREGFDLYALVSYEEFSQEWQRQMFLAPEPEVPKAIQDLIKVRLPETLNSVCEVVNASIIEAYRRGKEGK